MEILPDHFILIPLHGYYTAALRLTFALIPCVDNCLWPCKSVKSKEAWIVCSSIGLKNQFTSAQLRNRKCGENAADYVCFTCLQPKNVLLSWLFIVLSWTRSQYSWPSHISSLPGKCQWTRNSPDSSLWESQILARETHNSHKRFQLSVAQLIIHHRSLPGLGHISKGNKSTWFEAV